MALLEKKPRWPLEPLSTRHMTKRRTPTCSQSEEQAMQPRLGAQFHILLENSTPWASVSSSVEWKH